MIAGSQPAVSESNLYGRDRRALAEALARYGVRGFRARQVYRWLYARDRHDPAGWTDLPLRLRRALLADTRVEAGAIAMRAEAGDGTVKYRIALAGGGEVEAVHLMQAGRVTLCLSSQVGCALGCGFCLTARMGLVRQLDPGEILGQVSLIRRDRSLPANDYNLVFMGMGEPLHNYDAVMAALRILVDEDGFGLSRRRVTVSTSGLAPAIERLAREDVVPRLAVSLNATTDRLRDRLMPINRRYPIERLLAACRTFARLTGERLTLEYVLLSGVNDGDEDVARLDRIARALPARLNLIPFNEVPDWLEFRSPSRRRVLAIRDRLLARGRPVSVRWSRGAETRAACGQLALLPDAPGGEREAGRTAARE